MDIFKNGILLPIDINKKINNFTFNGTYYYFTVKSSKEIIKTNFNIKKCYKTCREYDCICYDYKENCFWASSLNCSNIIFKLNCNMSEVDCIKINSYKTKCNVITGISYNCCKDSLLISFINCIFEIKKSNRAILKYNSKHMPISNILSICPCLMITCIKNRKQHIFLFDNCDKIIYSCIADCNMQIKNIIFNPCLTQINQPIIECLMLKNGCKPYMYIKQLYLNKLCFQPCRCNYNICKDDCINPISNNEDACNNILNSIALIEASLSHILNSEGEKLQKILKSTNNIEEILCVNKEVNKSIINITQLEHVLYSKLISIVDYCDYQKTCNKCCCKKYN